MKDDDNIFPYLKSEYNLQMKKIKEIFGHNDEYMFEQYVNSLIFLHEIRKQYAKEYAKEQAIELKKFISENLEKNKNLFEKTKKPFYSGKITAYAEINYELNKEIKNER